MKSSSARRGPPGRKNLDALRAVSASSLGPRSLAMGMRYLQNSSKDHTQCSGGQLRESGSISRRCLREGAEVVLRMCEAGASGPHSDAEEMTRVTRPDKAAWLLFMASSSG